MDFRAVLEVIEEIPLSSTRRVSGRLCISQSSVFCYLHDLVKMSEATKSNLTLKKYYWYIWHSRWSLVTRYISLVGWLVGWFINLCRLFKAKSIFMKIVLFQTILFGISTQFKCKYSLIVKKTFLFQAIQFIQAVPIHPTQSSTSTNLVHTQLNAKTVLYKTNQFSVSIVSMSKNSSISNNSV